MISFSTTSESTLVKCEVVFVAKQEDIYGANATIENDGVIKGAYHSKSGKFVLIASNLQGQRDGLSRIRHKVLGHYGLNTFIPKDKRDLLWKIIDSKDELKSV